MACHFPGKPFMKIAKARHLKIRTTSRNISCQLRSAQYGDHSHEANFRQSYPGLNKKNSMPFWNP